MLFRSHQNLLIEYRKQNWNFCDQALEHLVGFWDEDLDTFYASLAERISQYKEQAPEEDWDGVVQK